MPKSQKTAKERAEAKRAYNRERARSLVAKTFVKTRRVGCAREEERQAKREEKADQKLLKEHEADEKQEKKAEKRAYRARRSAALKRLHGYYDPWKVWTINRTIRRKVQGDYDWKWWANKQD